MIDHRDIYEECERKYGKALDLAIKSTYNPKTKKFYGFSDSYVPALINYRKDLWDAVGTVPNTWEDIRRGGRKIKLLHDKPVGIGLAQNSIRTWPCAPLCTRLAPRNRMPTAIRP